MKQQHRRFAAGALALALGVSQLPLVSAADTTTTTTTTTTAPTGTPPAGAPPTGTPPTGTPPAGTPPTGTQGGGQAASYSDVSSSAWYANYVNFVSMRGIMTGANGKFSPDTTITRAAYVQALYQAAGSPAVTSKTSFGDVSSDASYASAVAWAKEKGIATGDASGQFDPNGSLTREMAMTFLYRALSSLNLTAETVSGDPLSKFSDQTKVSSWAKDAMGTLAQMGVITGTDKGTINPQNALTNAEVAAMLYRALGGSSQQGGTPPNGQGGTSTTVSNGTGSPAIYSTANIIAKNATLTATNSEAVVVEGKNAVTLTNCDVTGNMTGTYNDSSENIHNVMLYQSMSGDAEVGHASFTMTGGSLKANAGDLFYVTNTSSTITLCDVDLSLTSGSAFSGTINTSGQGGTVKVTVDSGSTWTLTGDCYVTSVSNSGTIDYNGYTIHLADGTTLTA